MENKKHVLIRSVTKTGITFLNDYGFIFYLLFRINNDLFLYKRYTRMKHRFSLYKDKKRYRWWLKWHLMMMTKIYTWNEKQENKTRGNEWQITTDIFYLCISASWYAFSTTIVVVIIKSDSFIFGYICITNSHIYKSKSAWHWKKKERKIHSRKMGQ